MEHPPAGLRDGVTAAHGRYRYGTGRCRQSGINAVMFVLALMLLMTPQAQDTLSASQVSSDRYDSPAVRTVTSGQIASMPDASVPELLRHTAGVQIRDYGGLGGLKTVNVRSLGSQHTGVFVDGVKVNNVQNGQVDLGRYCSEDLESVSVSNGGLSSLLQSASEQASSATVSLRTAFPDFSRPWSLAARAEYGSFTTGSAYLSAMKRLSRRSCLKVTGDCRHTEGDYPFTYTNRYGADTTARRQNSDLTSFQIGPSFLMRSEKSLLHLKANWYHSDRGLPGPVIRQSGPSLCGDRQRDDDVFIQGNYRYSLRKFSMKLAGKYAYSCCNYLQDTVGNSSSRRLDLHYRQQEAYFSTAAAYRHGNFGFSLAWDNTVSCLDSDVSGLSGKRRWSSMLAAQAEYCYKDLSVNASAVYHHALDFSSRASGTSQVSTGAEIREADLSCDRISPYLSIRYSPGNFRFLAYWKNSFRLPTFNELYYVAVPSANAAHVLRPETVDQFDFTALYSVSAGPWSCGCRADLFYNITEDKIVWLPAANQFVWSAFNYGLVHGYGCTLSMNHSFVFRDFRLDALLDWTYERSEDMTDPQSAWYRGQTAYVPLHSVSAVVSAEYRGWSLSASFIYNSVRYRTSANTDANLLDPYADLDLMVSRKFRDFLKLSVAVTNVTDSHYEIISRYPMPGISYKVVLQFNI